MNTEVDSEIVQHLRTQFEDEIGHTWTITAEEAQEYLETCSDLNIITAAFINVAKMTRKQVWQQDEIVHQLVPEQIALEMKRQADMQSMLRIKRSRQQDTRSIGVTNQQLADEIALRVPGLVLNAAQVADLRTQAVNRIALILQAARNTRQLVKKYNVRYTPEMSLAKLKEYLQRELDKIPVRASHE